MASMNESEVVPAFSDCFRENQAKGDGKQDERITLWNPALDQGFG